MTQTSSTSQIFSLSREGMYMRKYVKEQWRTLLLRSALMVGVMALCGLLVAFANNYAYDSDRVEHFLEWNDRDPLWGDMIATMLVLLYVFSAISASMTFGGLSRKESRLGELMFPASQAEKFLARWLIYIPGFVVLFFLGLYVADVMRLTLTHAIAENPEYARLLTYKAFCQQINGEYVVVTPAKMGLTAFIGVQAVFMLGSIFWHRNSFVKTFICVSLLALGYFFVGYFTVESLGNTDYMRSSTQIPAWQIYYTVLAIVTAFCYVVGFMRYREMDINSRM